ncbi:Conserved membrane protein of uncharacterised function [Mycobacterium tuberculosis]|nr:DUF4247 domain-containing protein [Mycobacterium tuberculosis]CKP56383.1 Conserved membrane protein of uncharacterised function [Mycobacterium tuberculosis]CNM65809.1 Conserved membrane protein of uncharacterised function [Mycobacterium tuberculosis]
MSRNRLFLVAGSLAVAAAVSLISGITLLNRDVGSYIASHYRQESRDVNGTRYLCTGSPKQVATTLVKYQTPAARASHTDTEYLRYRNNVVTVGPDGTYPCIIRVENLSAGYNHGAYVFLGPGFTPGSPSGGSGGSPGGPGGSK